jgi:hypothetical protein
MTERRSAAARIAELEARQKEIDKRKKEVTRRLNKLRSVESEQERKADTRRKIIIGAIVLDHAKTRPDFAQWLQHQIDNLGERDKAAFDGWVLPK